MEDEIRKSHPSFMLSDDDLGLDRLSDDAMQGLMAMKYDPEDLTSQAQSYKEEGNLHIQKKKFDLAIENYTAGLKLNCDDSETNAQLYFNRGVAHFKLGNYRTALGDFDWASKLISSYFKAIFKAAECCLHLKRFDDCLSRCQRGFEIEPENKLLIAVMEKCKTQKEAADIMEQKRVAAIKRSEMEENALMTALKSHGVRFHPTTVFTADWFGTHCPQRSAPKFAPDSDQSAICWPILLSYPEMKKQDFVESFNEQLSFLDMLEMVLGVEAHRNDIDQIYKPSTCDVYFENSFKQKLVQVDVKAPLLNTLRHSDFIVLEGTPSFVVLCKENKDFRKRFRQEYKSVDLL